MHPLTLKNLIRPLVCLVLFCGSYLHAQGAALPKAQGLSELIEQEVERSVLPDGTPLTQWRDLTDYTRSYHVDQNHPDASDQNPGTESLPWLTISKAAATLKNPVKR